MPSNWFLKLPNGAKMPAIGLGTLFAKDEAELEAALVTAIECGYRHIDTAFLYDNEALIGKALKKLFEAGKVKREDLFITTKLPLIAIYPEKVEEYLKISLENLQLDYVDLYLVHYPVAFKRAANGTDLEPASGKTDHLGVWKKMEEQVDAGRAKAIGLSNFNIPQIENILKNCRIKPANLQIEVHVYFQQDELLAFCREKGISVVAYAPVGSPGLKQLGLPQKTPDQKELPEMLENPTVKGIAEKHSKTIAQVLLRYLLQLGVAVIPKSVNPVRIKQNIDIVDFNLDDKDMQALKGLDQGAKGRIFDSRQRFKGIENHPDYPFGK